MEQFKQKAIDELRSDGFNLFKKATEALEESRERILRENSERVKVVTTYAVMELTKFGFSPESYAFTQHKVAPLQKQEVSSTSLNKAQSITHSRMKLPENMVVRRR